MEHAQNTSPPSHTDSVNSAITKVSNDILKINDTIEKLIERVASLQLNIPQDITQTLTTPQPSDPPDERYVLLERRISALEETLSTQRASQTVNINQLDTPVQTTNMKKTLIIGDHNLRDVKMSDLNKNCAIRTLHGANTDLLKCWIQEKLTWSPQHCIIYGGLFDAMEGRDPSEVIDNLSALVSELKGKN